MNKYRLLKNTDILQLDDAVTLRKNLAVKSYRLNTVNQCASSGWVTLDNPNGFWLDKLKGPFKAIRAK